MVISLLKMQMEVLRLIIEDYDLTSSKVPQSGTGYYRIASVQQPQGDKLTFSYDSDQICLGF
jgi:hypothetical protein